MNPEEMPEEVLARLRNYASHLETEAEKCKEHAKHELLGSMGHALEIHASLTFKHALEKLHRSFPEVKRNKEAYDEYLDLVDVDDNIIGREKRSVVYLQNVSNFRVINAFIVNSDGELWIPRRTATKKMFPLCLDVSVGGHVESGEGYEQAFKRETKEEINLNLDDISYRLLGHLTPQKQGVSAHQHVYEIRSDLVPDYNRDDFVEDFWLKPKELLARIESGEKAKSDLPKLVRIFYGS